MAWPTVLTMTSYTVMQFVDRLMVGQVSDVALAAQGNGGIWAYVPVSVAFGFVTVVNTFVSQNLGAGRPEESPRYAWAAIWSSIAYWLIVLLPLAMVMPMVFAAMHEDPELIALESQYARILLVGGILSILAKSLHHFFFGLHRPRVVTVSALVGNIVNIGANYVLIFGEAGIPNWGLPGIPGTPALGIAGAAYGTLLGTAIEVLIPAAIFLGPKLNRQIQSRRQWRCGFEPIRGLCRLGWPGALQLGNEIICWAIFMTQLVGTFGTMHMTAGWIALGYMQLSFMPGLGFSFATTSIVGRYIGAGHPEIAVARARTALVMALIYMTTCAVAMYVFRTPLAAFFVGGDVPPDRAAEIVRIGSKLLICAAVFQTIDAIGLVYTGALRGAGDVVWPGIMTLIFSWTLIIGVGYAFVAFAPNLESIGPWIAAAIYIVVYGLAMGARFESGRWRSIRLLGGISGPVPPGPPASTPDAAVRDLGDMSDSAPESPPVVGGDGDE